MYFRNHSGIHRTDGEIVEKEFLDMKCRYYKITDMQGREHLINMSTVTKEGLVADPSTLCDVFIIYEDGKMAVLEKDDPRLKIIMYSKNALLGVFGACWTFDRYRIPRLVTCIVWEGNNDWGFVA